MNKFQSALRATGAAITAGFLWTSQKIAEQISLVPAYLRNLLWLINQTYADLVNKGYKGNAAVYAALRLLCSSVPEPPLVPHILLADGEEGDALPWNHELRRLIRSPNPLTTEYEFWELVTLHCGAVGRSTWWKERDNAGRLIALWPLRPDRIGPIYGIADNAGAERVLAGWSYLVPGTTTYVPIPRQDVLLFNLPDPMGESGGLVEGLGPLQVLASEIGADNEATKYVGSLLANDARPGTVLEVAGTVTNQDDADLIKAAYSAQYGGRNRGKVGIVDKGTKVISVGFNLSQLEFPNLRRISESRVCAAFGTPSILVGLLVGLESGIRATISEQREFFTETTLANYWRRFSDTYTNDIAAEYGLNIVCRFDISKCKALAAQTAAEVVKIRDAYDRGVITPNEYRDALNLAPHADGDFLPAAQKPQLVLAAADPETGTNPVDATALPSAGVSLNGAKPLAKAA